MHILGISAYYHDSAAALVRDGRIVAAAQEERFTRQKNDARFPHHAIEYCLTEAGLSAGELEHVVFYDKPFLKFERLLETYLAFAPRGFRSFRLAMPLWLREKLFLKRLLLQELDRHGGVDESKLLFTEHHQSHAASAFFPSPFLEAAVLTMDGVGEWATTSVGHGRGNGLDILQEIHFPHSLGLLYSAFTYYLGFKVNSGEYKVMGLAPYGEPRYAGRIRDHLIELKDDGSFRLDQAYFDYCTGLRMTNGRFADLFEGPERRRDDPMERRHLDLAASVQVVTEEAVLNLARSARRETGSKRLCLAGGVALNCVANGRLLREEVFDEIWIQPAAGDAGGALGAALAAYHQFLRQPREAPGAPAPGGRDAMHGALLGPEYSQDEIERRLEALGARFRTLDEAALMEACVDDLEQGRALGWFQGRMEFGPRALGARSILADARSPEMQSRLNLKIKFRESFRPFAPSVLAEDAAEWFDLPVASPYMLLVAEVASGQRVRSDDEVAGAEGLDKLRVVRSRIPAVTHVDCSARVQTVDGNGQPRYRRLLEAFKARTGCPVLVNTSFNVRGEPIICSPEDAWRCFMRTDLDTLAIGNCLLRKEEQDHVPARSAPPPEVELD